MKAVAVNGLKYSPLIHSAPKPLGLLFALHCVDKAEIKAARVLC